MKMRFLGVFLMLTLWCGIFDSALKAQNLEQQLRKLIGSLRTLQKELVRYTVAQQKLRAEYQKIERITKFTYEEIKDDTKRAHTLKNAKEFINELCGDGMPEVKSGYIFLKSRLMEGERDLAEGGDVNVKYFDNQHEKFKNDKIAYGFDEELKKLQKQALKKIKESAVQQYKIHLMPATAEDMMIVLEQILKRLTSDEKFRESFFHIKYKTNIPYHHGREALFGWLLRLAKGNIQDILPLIVIYPATGREHAQYVLDVLYEMFKDMPGLDIKPRFNEKVTSLIYYAQGDGDYKKIKKYEHFFTTDKLFYSPHFVSKKKAAPSYALKNPARGKNP